MNPQDEQARLISALSRLSQWPADAGLPVAHVDSETASQAFYRFTTGSVQWLFPAGLKAKLVTDLPIAALPGAGPVLAGLCQDQGQLVPVYRLHALLGEAAPARPVTLLLQPEHHSVGLIVDSPPQRCDFKPDEQSPTDTPHPLIQRVYEQADERYYLLALHALGSTLPALGVASHRGQGIGLLPTDTISETVS